MNSRRLFFASTVAVLVWSGMKLLRTYAVIGDLGFLLWPVDRLVSLAFTSGSRLLAEGGYWHERLGIVIDDSCSGYSFWAICSAMLVFMFGERWTSSLRFWALIPVAIFGAYLMTLMANGGRILSAVLLKKHAALVSSFPWFHHAEGTFMYLSFLILIYLGTKRILLRRS